MADKLLITLPCNIRELKAKIDSFDSCDVVMCKYDGDGDSLYVISDCEDTEKSHAEPKDITKCTHRVGGCCGHPTMIESGKRRILAGMRPLFCPFEDGNECKYYEPMRTDPIQQTNNFVQTLEAAYEASKGSQIRFK